MASDNETKGMYAERTREVLNDSVRIEGVYCRWETYPAMSDVKDNLLVIERVNGDTTVSSITMSRREAETLFAFLLDGERYSGSCIEEIIMATDAIRRAILP